MGGPGPAQAEVGEEGGEEEEGVVGECPEHHQLDQAGEQQGRQQGG